MGGGGGGGVEGSGGGVGPEHPEPPWVSRLYGEVVRWRVGAWPGLRTYLPATWVGLVVMAVDGAWRSPPHLQPGAGTNRPFPLPTQRTMPNWLTESFPACRHNQASKPPSPLPPSPTRAAPMPLTRSRIHLAADRHGRL